MVQTAKRERLLTVDEAADILACHPMTVRKLIWRGELSSVRLGPQSVRIDVRDLETFIRQRREGVA